MKLTKFTIIYSKRTINYSFFHSIWAPFSPLYPPLYFLNFYFCVIILYSYFVLLFRGIIFVSLITTIIYTRFFTRLSRNTFRGNFPVFLRDCPVIFLGKFSRFFTLFIPIVRECTFFTPYFYEIVP